MNVFCRIREIFLNCNDTLEVSNTCDVVVVCRMCMLKLLAVEHKACLKFVKGGYDQVQLQGLLGFLFYFTRYLNNNLVYSI